MTAAFVYAGNGGKLAFASGGNEFWLLRCAVCSLRFAHMLHMNSNSCWGAPRLPGQAPSLLACAP